MRKRLDFIILLIIGAAAVLFTAAYNLMPGWRNMYVFLMAGALVGVWLARFFIFMRAYIFYQGRLKRYWAHIKNLVRKKITAWWSSIARRLEQSNLRHIRQLSYFTDEKSVVIQGKIKRAGLFKPRKWKRLTTNRERVRFIYAVFINRRAREGFPIGIHETPNEIEASLINAKSETPPQLFALYNQARYRAENHEIQSFEVDGLLPVLRKK